MVITLTARPGESFWVVRDFVNVLLCNDVVDMKNEIGDRGLGETAVFATVARSFSDQSARPCVHRFSQECQRTGRLPVGSVEPDQEQIAAKISRRKWNQQTIAR